MYTPLVLVLLVCAGARATLVCSTRADALALAAAAIGQASDARFFLGRISPHALTNPAELDALLTNELHVLVASNATGLIAASDDDVRQLYSPDAWVAYAPMAVAASGGNCSLLIASLATGPPPAEVRDMLSAIVSYGALLATDRTCDGANEVPVRSNSTGVYACACADGRVCAASLSVTTMLETTVAIMLLVAIILGILLGMASVVMLMIQMGKARRPGRRRGDEEALVVG